MIGTLPRFLLRMEELFLHLTRLWLRLGEKSEDANRARWLMHPTWSQLRKAFWSSCWCSTFGRRETQTRPWRVLSGRMRLLRRMEAGVIRSLEVEDASPPSTTLRTLQRWMERVAESGLLRRSWGASQPNVDAIRSKIRPFRHGLAQG
jgi:hypothetical protein